MASARRWLRVGPGLECQPALFIAQRMKVFVRCSLFFSIAANLAAADLPASARQFVERHCFECHDAETQKGGLNLAALQFDLANPTNFSRRSEERRVGKECRYAWSAQHKEEEKT